MSLGDHPHLAIPTDAEPWVSAIMAGWWRSSYERPYSDKAAWKWSAGDAWWWSSDWREDSPEGWRNVQETDLPAEWTAMDLWGDEHEGPPTVTPPTLEATVHEVEQYPWARQQPQEDNCESGSPRRETTAPLDATQDPPSENDAGRMTSHPSSVAVLQRTAQEEKSALEKLHAEVLRKFRLTEHNPESDSEDGDEHHAAAPCDIEDPVDPEIGTYDPKTKAVHCVICDIPLNSKEQFQDHLKGKKHWKKYDRYLKRKAQEELEGTQVAAVTPFQ